MILHAPRVLGPALHATPCGAGCGNLVDASPAQAERIAFDGAHVYCEPCHTKAFPRAPIEEAAVGDVVSLDFFPVPPGHKRTEWWDRITEGGRVFVREGEGYRRES